MLYILAFLPILIVLVLMLVARWGGQKAGPVGWLAGLAVSMLAFGLSPAGVWISQVKGLFLSLFVLLVLWPALVLFNIVKQAGGIQAISYGLERAIARRSVLLIVVAWAFSGWMEGVAGFGLPVAVVAPMLVHLGVEPVLAVAAVAVGHAWSVTMGDMGVVFQALVAVSNMDPAALAPAAAILLGVACLACGLAVARLLGAGRYWPLVVVLALVMAGVQYGLCAIGLVPLAAFMAGLAGVAGGILLGRGPREPRDCAAEPREAPAIPLRAALAGYALVSILMIAIALVKPLRAVLYPMLWQMSFPQVVTGAGFSTPAGPGQAIRPLVHPGSALLVAAVATYLFYRWRGYCAPGSWRSALFTTWRTAAPASVGVLSMVGLATLMDHAGMTMTLAQELSRVMGNLFPLASPLVGVLGAFATGSNTNSNVLFASLQKNAALMLALDPRILLAAQTTGGALGSMLAPAKVIVGCSTVGLKDHDGDVLRLTVPYGIVISLIVGVIVLAWIARG